MKRAVLIGVALLSAFTPAIAQEGLGVQLTSKKGAPRIILLALSAPKDCLPGESLAATMDVNEKPVTGCVDRKQFERDTIVRSNGQFTIRWKSYGPQVYDISEWDVGPIGTRNDGSKPLGAPSK